MKLNQIISIIILSIYCATTAVNAIQYLHMKPFSSSNCSDAEEYGVGFAFQIGVCFGINSDGIGSKNFFVKLDHTGNNATISQFKDADITCSTPDTSLDVTYSIGECYNAPHYSDSDIYQAENYVSVSLQTNPTSIPRYGFRSTTYGDSQCASHPQYYYFYTNGTTFHNGPGDYSVWYCTDNEAYESMCQNGPSSCFVTVSSSTCTRNFLEWHEKNYIEETC